MKIAFIITNLRWGGAEKAVINLASLLANRGHEVHVVLFERLVEHAIPSNFTLHTLARKDKASSKGVIGKYLFAFLLRRLFKKISRPAPFDLIVSTLPFVDEVVALSGVQPVWYRIANTLSSEIALLQERHPRKAERRYQRYRRLYNGANIIAVSEGVREDLRHSFKLEGTRIEQIYNPFDLAAIKELADQGDPDLPDVPYVVHVGRFAPQKRHDLLLKAWKNLDMPEYRLVLLTQPSPALDAMVRGFNLQSQVVVAGFRKNPYPWIKNARLLVLCSDHEGMPNVLVEALACGTPVVSTDCPSGPRELLANCRNARLVPTGDAAALTLAIQSTLNSASDPESADLSAFEAGRIVEHYERLPGLLRGKKKD